jgi:hypothetical protein
MWGALVALLMGLFDRFLGHKTNIAKEAGTDEQALRDVDAGRAVADAAATASAGAAVDLVQREPAADNPVGDTGPEHSDPNLKWRD